MAYSVNHGALYRGPHVLQLFELSPLIQAFCGNIQTQSTAGLFPFVLTGLSLGGVILLVDFDQDKKDVCSVVRARVLSNRPETIVEE